MSPTSENHSTHISDSAAGIFANHTDAEEAVKALQRSGFDLKSLSVVGRDYNTEEHVVGYYNMGDRAATWGKNGLFWGWIWGVLFGSAFLFIPGIGPVIIGGHLVSLLLGALETSVVVGGLTALGGALSSIGIPRDSILRYETALKTNQFLVMVHGTKGDVVRARGVLMQNKGIDVEVHHNPDAYQEGITAQM